eukprot:129025_1
MDPQSEHSNAHTSTSQSANSGTELVNSKHNPERSNFTAMEEEVTKVAYDFSLAQFVLNYNIFVILFVVLLFCMGINYAPYNSQYAANFNLIVLFGFWYTGFELILAYFVLFCHSSINYHVLRLLCVITMAVCALEGIIGAIWIESVFGTLFSLQLITTDFVSIYSSLYLLILGKMRKSITWILVIQLIHFVFKVYSLGMPQFIYVHNEVLKPSAVGWVWRWFFSLTKLVLATEIVCDKLHYIADAIFHQTVVQIDAKALKTNQIVFAVLSVVMLLFCVILYSASGHWSSGENEANGYYPVGIFLTSMKPKP